MCPFVPFLEHRRDTVFPAAPGSMPAMVPHWMTPAPARTPEEEAQGSESHEEEEEQDQETEKSKTKSEWAMVGHSPAIVIRIRHRRRLTRGRLDRDGRSLGNPS